MSQYPESIQVLHRSAGLDFQPNPALFTHHPSHWVPDKTAHLLNSLGGQLTRTLVPPLEGTRYYDLSNHPLEEANLLAIELIDYGHLPCRMPDDYWLYPSR